MYLVSTQTSINWVLGKTNNPVVIGDFFIATVKPTGDFSLIAVTNLLPPTQESEGQIDTQVTPDTEGLWEIALVKGTETSYILLSKVSLFVFSADTEVVPPGFK